MIWFLRLLAASALAAFGFPKVLLTERIWPRMPENMEWQNDRPWTHNIKDDLTDWMDRDTEWWMKFYNFTILVLALLAVLT